MGRGRLFGSFLLSLSLHLFAVTVFLAATRSPEVSQPIAIELFAPPGPGTGPAPGSPPPAIQPPEPPAPPPRKPPPKPVARRPLWKGLTVHGVRLATPEDIRARMARDVRPAVPPAPPPVAAAPAPPAPAGPPASSAAPASMATRGGGAAAPGIPGGGITWETHGWSQRRWVSVPRGFSPDAPGYHGRAFGQISVRGSNHGDRVYGRIHLFPASSWYRDYSARSLFGYSFRQELGYGAVREFQTGRTKTAGAYLIVTDLYADGRISKMGHTVVLAFPRVSPRGGDLYAVEEASGDFRLRGPAGSFLLFDGQRGFLRQAAGFMVSPPGAPGTAPRVGYRGLHVRLHAIGSNPFLLGRPASVVDARGRGCALSTSELFVYPRGRRESDVFRFTADADFFRFLAARCPGLDLPRPAATRVAAAKPKRPAAKGGTGGLIPGLLAPLR